MHHIPLRILKTGIVTGETPILTEDLASQAELLSKKGLRLLDTPCRCRSCNGCEVEIGMMNGPCYMLEHLGFRFVASPRHADLLLVTGPVSRHMKEALLPHGKCQHQRLLFPLEIAAMVAGFFQEVTPSREALPLSFRWTCTSPVALRIPKQ